MADKEEIIRKTYYNPSTGFTGIEKLFRQLKKDGHSNISRVDIKKFLQKQEVSQLAKKKTQPSVSWIPRFPLQEFQIDLIYLENKHLNQNSYGLTSIDAFTKKGDIELLKNKDEINVVNATKKILNRMGVPKMVYCDEGSEFTSGAFKNLMNDNKIELVFTLSHATMVERFNRTIKELLEKYLRSTKTKTITNVLPKILENYNNSYHKTIGMAPNEVNEETQHIAQLNLIKHSTKDNREKIKVGDTVRVMLKRKGFVKGYKPKFSTDVHTVLRKEKNFYYVSNLRRGYFRSELMKVDQIEHNPEEADLESTREGNLKEIAKRPIDPQSIKEKEILVQEKSLAPLSLRRERRNIVKPKRYQEEKPKNSLPAPAPKFLTLY